MASLRSLFDVCARFSLLTLLVALPAFFIPSSSIAISQAKFLIIAVLLGVSVVSWALARLLEGHVSFPRSALLIASAMLPIAYAVSAFVSSSFYSSFVSGVGEQDTVAVIALSVLLLWATALYVRTAERLRDVVLALVGGLALLVVFESVRLLVPAVQSFGGYFPSAVATSTGTWHDLGILAGLAAFVSAFFPLSGLVRSNIMRALMFAISAVSLILLLIVSMSDIWYVLAGICALTVAYLLVKEERHSTAHMVGAVGPWVVFAVVALLCGWFSGPIHDSLPERFRHTSVEIRPSWQGTYDIGQDVLAGGKTLFFGSGPNSFSKNWVRNKPDGVNETVFWNFDFNSGVGTVPTSLITLGFLGVLAWALLIVAYLYSFGSAMRRMGGSEAAAVFALGSAVIYLLAFQVIYVPGVVGSLLLFAFLGAFAGVVSMHKHTQLTFGLSDVRKFANSMVVVIPAVLVLLVSIPGTRAVASDIFVNQSVTGYAADQDTAKATARVQKAIAFWPSNDRAHRAAVELGILELARLAQSGDSSSQEQLQSTLSRTIQHGLSAVSIDEGDYQNWLMIAQLYQELSGAGVEGAIGEAKKAYAAVVAENPTNPIPHVRLAQLSIAENDLTAAAQHLDEAIRLKQNFTLAHFLRSQVLAQSGNLEGALASAAIVVQLAPQDPSAWYALGTILYVGQSWSDAATAFAQAAILQPDFANAYFMYALCAARVGEFEQAVQALVKVAELDPAQNNAIAAMVQNVMQGKQPLEGFAQ